MLTAIAIGVVCLVSCTNNNNNDNNKDILTLSERQWLIAHPNLRLAPDPLFPPIEFFDGDGNFNGFAAEYFAEIEKVIDYKFQIVHLKTWSELIEKLKNKEIDLTSAAERNAEREQFVEFTKSWIAVPNVIITKDTNKYNLSLESLDGWTVAVTKGYVLEKEITTNYPNIKLVLVDDDAEALSQVSMGNVRAAITNLAVSSFVISKQGITNLRAHGSLNRDDKLCIAVRQDFKILKYILNKAINSIPESRFQEIKSKWIKFSPSTPDPDNSLMWKRIIIIAVIITALFLIVLFLNWTLNKKVKSKTRELELELNARIKAESQIILLNRDLENRVEERTAELKSLLELLENEIEERKQTELVLKTTQDELTISLESEKELNNLKTRFVSMVSHEYRTPLTVILSSASLLEIYFSSGDKSNFDKHTQRIQRSVKTMTALLNDALFIGKTDAIGLQLKLESIKLKDFIEILIADAKRNDNTTHSINLNYLIDDESVEIDPDILTHILINLLSNALKYSPAESEVTVNVTHNNQSLNIEVIDVGIGIPASEQKHLFTPFHRFTNVKNIDGTGLGMAIVKRCADILNASIAIESEINKGTKITISIPCH